VAFDGATFAASLVGGTVGGTALTRYYASRTKRDIRKGRARLLHEDLMHLQGTLARTFYAEEIAWWDESWLLPLVTTSVDRRDLFTALSHDEYATLASALGWMDYLIEGRKAARPPPTDAELTRIYERLAAARYGLRRVGDFTYRPHRHEQMKPATGGRADGAELPGVRDTDAQAILDRASATSDGG
jgi:hypothetical protein